MTAGADFGAFVLAGGRSTRMGFDKAGARIAGSAMVERMLAKLRALGLTPVIAGGSERLASHARLAIDRYPGCGPLAGIEAGLSASGYVQNLFVGVDLPLLSTGILSALLSRAQSTGALATVPVLAGRPQPLCAIYHRGLLPVLRGALERGDYKVMRVLREAAERQGSLDLPGLEALVTAGGGAALDVSWRDAFLNCNTPEQLAEVEWKITSARIGPGAA